MHGTDTAEYLFGSLGSFSRPDEGVAVVRIKGQHRRTGESQPLIWPETFPEYDRQILGDLAGWHMARIASGRQDVEGIGNSGASVSESALMG